MSPLFLAFRIKRIFNQHAQLIYFSYFFGGSVAEALRKRCGRFAEAKIPFCQQTPSPTEFVGCCHSSSIGIPYCLKLLLNSIGFLTKFDDFSSRIMNSKHLKVHVLRKLAEALRKLPAEAKI